MDLLPEGTDPLPSAAEAGNFLFVSGTDSSTLITSSFQDAVGLYTLDSLKNFYIRGLSEKLADEAALVGERGLEFLARPPPFPLPELVED